MWVTATEGLGSADPCLGRNTHGTSSSNGILIVAQADSRHTRLLPGLVQFEGSD